MQTISGTITGNISITVTNATPIYNKLFYTTSGTFTAPSGITRVKVTSMGGGGGGA